MESITRIVLVVIAHPSVSDSEIIKILKLVNLYQFIVSLPQGLLTIMNDSDNDNDNGNENEMK